MPNMKLYKSDEEKQIEQAKKEAFRDGKIKGARQFALIVKEMRDHQQAYFQTRDNSRLKKAKECEQRVDEALKMILK